MCTVKREDEDVSSWGNSVDEIGDVPIDYRVEIKVGDVVLELYTLGRSVPCVCSLVCDCLSARDHQQ